MGIPKRNNALNRKWWWVDPYFLLFLHPLKSQKAQCFGLRIQKAASHVCQKLKKPMQSRLGTSSNVSQGFRMRLFNLTESQQPEGSPDFREISQTKLPFHLRGYLGKETNLQLYCFGWTKIINHPKSEAWCNPKSTTKGKICCTWKIKDMLLQAQKLKLIEVFEN